MSVLFDYPTPGSTPEKKAKITPAVIPAAKSKEDPDSGMSYRLTQEPLKVSDFLRLTLLRLKKRYPHENFEPVPPTSTIYVTFHDCSIHRISVRGFSREDNLESKKHRMNVERCLAKASKESKSSLKSLQQEYMVLPYPSYTSTNCLLTFE